MFRSQATGGRGGQKDPKDVIRDVLYKLLYPLNRQTFSNTSHHNILTSPNTKFGPIIKLHIQFLKNTAQRTFVFIYSYTQEDKEVGTKSTQLFQKNILSMYVVLLRLGRLWPLKKLFYTIYFRDQEYFQI
jgi:hypothetical protein